MKLIKYKKYYLSFIAIIFLVLGLSFSSSILSSVNNGQIRDREVGSDLKSKDFLFLNNGNKINFKHSDNNDGEDFIIKSDKEIYTGMGSSEVFFSVFNPGEKTMAEIRFPNAGKIKFSKVKKYSSQKIEEIIPTFETKEYEQRYCTRECSHLSQRKTSRPSKSELKKLIDSNFGWTQMGKMFGVSDNAVRKWAKKYGLI